MRSLKARLGLVAILSATATLLSGCFNAYGVFLL